jgi:hypothetical protein
LARWIGTFCKPPLYPPLIRGEAERERRSRIEMDICLFAPMAAKKARKREDKQGLIGRRSVAPIAFNLRLRRIWISACAGMTKTLLRSGRFAGMAIGANYRRG